MLPIVHTLILYTSDSPDKFAYFSDAFTQRLNHGSRIEFVTNNKIEDQMILHSIKNKSSFDFEKSILNTTELIKKHIKAQKFEYARQIANKFLKDFENQLLQYPYRLPQTTLLNFHFWNIVAHLDDTHQTVDASIAAFLNSATLAQRTGLEAQLTQELYKQFSQIVYSKTPLLMKKYTIHNAEKCDFFVNGESYTGTTLLLSAAGHNILNAICETGFYSQILTAESKSNITILPKIDHALTENPSFESVPHDLLKAHNISYLVFVHWSSKKNYIQTIVMNATDFTEKRELFMQLKTKEDLQSAGDKISQFVSNYFKYLLELNLL